MQKEEIFAILGIDETKDERALKNAYRQQLMHTNPEDDPEGFKRLREAYEADKSLEPYLGRIFQVETDDTGKTYR